MKPRRNQKAYEANLVPRAFPLKKWVGRKSPGDEVVIKPGLPSQRNSWNDTLQIGTRQRLS